MYIKENGYLERAAVLDISCTVTCWTDGTLLEKGPNSRSWDNRHVKRNIHTTN